MSLPRVVVYNEVSVDGQVTGFPLDGEDYYRRGFDFPPDAILMGSRTAAAFGPSEVSGDRLLARPPLDRVHVPPGFEHLVSEPKPLLVIPDSAGAVHTWRDARAQPWYGPLVSVSTSRTPDEHLRYLEIRGVENLPAGDDRVDLRLMLELLADRYGVRTVRTDGGGALVGALLADGLVAEIVLLVRPVIATDAQARPMVEMTRRDASGIPLTLVECRPLDGGSLWLRYDVDRSGED